MKAKSDLKKLEVQDDLLSPETRAERLKRLRNIANLSRKEICESSGVNVNTYKGWELARFGGLSVDGAEKIVNRVMKAGVICTVEWLLYGTVPSPCLIPDESSEAISELESSPIAQEFAVFQNLFKNAVLEEVLDDSLLPNIKKGDFVAGVKRYGEEMELGVDKLCIIQTSDGKKLIRYLKKGDGKGLYSLLCVNPFSSSLDLVILNIKPLYAAPISRHYIL